MHFLVEYYGSIKSLHILAVVLTILFFAVRAGWSVVGSRHLQHPLVRILPHVIDTVLLVCGVLLALVIGPFQPWIITKVVLLVVYIGFGTYAIKRAKTSRGRLINAILAVLVFFYIVGVAVHHDPASWFA